MNAYQLKKILFDILFAVRFISFNKKEMYKLYVNDTEVFLIGCSDGFCITNITNMKLWLVR